jgi:hypothetical protein
MDPNGSKGPGWGDRPPLPLLLLLLLLLRSAAAKGIQRALSQVRTRSRRVVAREGVHGVCLALVCCCCCNSKHSLGLCWSPVSGLVLLLVAAQLLLQGLLLPCCCERNPLQS